MDAHEQTQKERLLIFLEYLRVGQNKFEKLAGLAVGSINHWRDNVPSKAQAKIFHAYPELNKVWLLTGVGEMLRQDANDDTIVNAGNMVNKNYGKVNMGVPTPNGKKTANTETEKLYEQIEELKQRVEELKTDKQELMEINRSLRGLLNSRR